ncbi:hypothetical protein [Roseivirga pacifica]|uniref:hypothetical protein n=1 Tax=Roseivirga pacifica TaxID=1267423 RepID=UPI00227C513D|nr:hypothetical protein [Roseivirga pacifica]
MKHLTILILLFSFGVCLAQEAPTIVESKTPLYVIKYGERTHYLDSQKENLDNISPEDILTISVLKGVSATSVYGDAAKDGAVLIHLKNEDFFNGERNTIDSGVLIREPGSTLKTTTNGVVITTLKEPDVRKLDMDIQDDDIKIYGETFNEQSVALHINFEGKVYEADLKTLKDIEVKSISDISVIKTQEELKARKLTDKTGLIIISLDTSEEAKKLVKKLKEVKK